jgi:DNA-binding Lrp family transcriptional regulator
MMDDLDLRLVALLRHDGRRSVSDLALELGTSRATVRSRMEKMEQRGDIVGYTVILRSDAVSQPVRGITFLLLEGRAKDRVVDALATYPDISAIHTTNGRWDLVVEIGAESLAHLDGLLSTIRLIPGVVGSETNLLLATPRSTRARL